ncbi:hypothetical protein FOA52_014409 [Chlamydomonas sp. UWO 241]|nr:hypothetical protein FOA52_014409 [Chlamydomonas sp. UWO 241]
MRSPYSLIMIMTTLLCALLSASEATPAHWGGRRALLQPVNVVMSNPVSVANTVNVDARNTNINKNVGGGGGGLAGGLMQMLRLVARAAAMQLVDAYADEDDEEDLNVGACVLLNGLLFAKIWKHLDAYDKKQLREVGRGVKVLVDSLVVELAMHGKPASDLGSALALWPDVERLAADCDDGSAAVLSAAPLSKLRALVLEHMGVEWSVPAISRAAAAGLHELHVSSSCVASGRPVLSIEAVRGCAQLRKLSLKGCKVSLAPLAGCVHLQELSIAASRNGSSDFSDLVAPLDGCAKLKKLMIAGSQVTSLAPLRGCSELQDLNISKCAQLVRLDGLEACSKLERLDMSHLSVSSLEPLSACRQLQDLNISSCSRLVSLDGLEACSKLERLDMSHLSPEQQPAPPAQPAWQPLMVEAVHRLCPEAHPSLFVLWLASRPEPAPSRTALLALGPVARITGRVQTAELWGAEAPLWANPLLQLELPAAQRSVQWREPTGDAAGHALSSPTDAARWLVDGLARVRDALPGMRTVTDLCALWAWLAAVDMVFAGLRGLEAAVPTLWRMPLLNARKEPIWRLWPPARSVAVERAGELATMDLWDALASFAEGGGMPRGCI